MDSNGLPETLAEATALLTPMYRPSRAIPGSVSSNLPEGLLALLDWLHQRYLEVQFSVRDLIDLESMPQEALHLVVLEMGLPSPSWATEAQLRAVVREAGYINRHRHTAEAWERFLNALAPTGVTVTVSGGALQNIYFMAGVYGHMFPGLDQLKTGGVEVDDIPYLIGPGHFDRDITIVIRSESPGPNAFVIPGAPTLTFPDFVRSTAKHFVPLVSETTDVYVILET